MDYSVLLLFCGIVGVIGKGQETMGPYDVVMNYVEKCSSDTKYQIQHDVRIRKISKTNHALDLNMSMPYPFDSSVGLQVVVAKWGNGGWKPNFYNTNINDICTVFKTVVSTVFKQITRQSGVPNKCPIPKANITLVDYHMNFNDISNNPIKIFFYGKFRLDIIGMRHNHKIFCFRMLLDTIPK